MTKKCGDIRISFWIWLLLTTMIFSTGCASNIDVEKSSVFDNTNIQEFSAIYFQNEIAQFPYQKQLSRILDVHDLLKKANSIFVEVYGNEVINEKPYQVFWDKDTEIWLVCGTLPLIPVQFGGAANVLIQNNGQVLAVWHGK